MILVEALFLLRKATIYCQGKATLYTYPGRANLRPMLQGIDYTHGDSNLRLDGDAAKSKTFTTWANQESQLGSFNMSQKVLDQYLQCVQREHITQVRKLY